MTFDLELKNRWIFFIADGRDLFALFWCLEVDLDLIYLRNLKILMKEIEEEFKMIFWAFVNSILKNFY